MAGLDPVCIGTRLAMRPLRSGSGPLPDDEGSASVLAAALVAVVVVMGVAVAAWTGAVSQAARAASAADMSALAAARVDRDHRALGASEEAALNAACSVALEVAGRNGAHLERCARAPAASVMVEVRVSGVIGMPAARATSRAGPRWG